MNHLPGLIYYSVDSGNRTDVGGNPTALFLLFLIRNSLASSAVTKLDSLNDYLLKLQDENLRNYFMKGHLTMENFNLDKIKAHKSKIIEDALLIFRLNLSVVEPGAKRQYFKLVEEVAGLEKSSSQAVLSNTANQGNSGYTRHFSKTVLTAPANNVDPAD